MTIQQNQIATTIAWAFTKLRFGKGVMEQEAFPFVEDVVEGILTTQGYNGLEVEEDDVDFFVSLWEDDVLALENKEIEVPKKHASAIYESVSQSFDVFDRYLNGEEVSIPHQRYAKAEPLKGSDTTVSRLLDSLAKG